MQIELYIDGEKKLFSVPYVPMLAKRKYLQIQADAEEKENPTQSELLTEEDALYSILSDVVFKGQFTLEQLYEGGEQTYIYGKLLEAVTGIKADDAKPDKSTKKK